MKSLIRRGVEQGMRKVRAGIIGCGGLGGVHVGCVSQIDGFDMVAYCDVFADKAEDMLSKYGGEYATTDPERLFGDDSLDAIYVTTLHDTHAELCVRALDAGKYVMVEKPLALTVADCMRVQEAVRRNGKKLMTAFKMRYYELLREARKRIPHPVMVTMQMMDNRWADDAWANDPVKGGGNVLSQGVHSTDVLRYVAGRDPIDVFAVGGNYYQKQNVVDNLTAVFRFEDNICASWIQGDCNCPPLPSKFFMQLFSENQSITLSDRLTTLTYTETGKDPVVLKGTETGFLEENIAFYECVANRAEPTIDHVDGLYATLMVLQAFESLKSGKPEPIRALIQQSVNVTL